MAKNKPLKTSASEAKEYLRGYYWLILAIDPYNLAYAFYAWSADAPNNTTGKANQLDMPIPDSVKTAMRETGEKGRSTQVHHPSGMYIFKDGDTDYYYNFDCLFRWFITKGVKPLATRDGKEITAVNDLKRLWEDNDLKPIKGLSELYPKWHFDRIEAYLAREHKKNLEELETTETLRERQKKGIVLVKIEGKDVDLVEKEALCLMALQKELKNKTEYIRPVHITM